MKVSSSSSVGHYQGLKEDSIFNQLSFFHVSAPGLPPCLAHDLLEGIIAYDMLLYVQHFVKKKWFSLNFLNYRISKFKYSCLDISSKPCIIPKTATRLPGNASQLRCFLKLFPLLVFSKIKNADDDVWQLVLMLRQITEIATCPVLTQNAVVKLQYAAQLYCMTEKKHFHKIH